MTRPPRRWFGYATVATLTTLVVLGLPFFTKAGMAVTQVAQLADALERPVPTPGDGTATGAPAIGSAVAEAAAPPAEPAAPPAEPAPPPPAPEPEAGPCAAALDGVAAAGLPLPAGVEYRCPSTRFAHQGAACWDAWPCPGAAFIAINMSLLQDASPEYLRHVVAHEICHIIDFRDRGWSTEPRADACAAEYGF